MAQVRPAPWGLPTSAQEAHLPAGIGGNARHGGAAVRTAAALRHGAAASGVGADVAGYWGEIRVERRSKMCNFATSRIAPCGNTRRFYPRTPARPCRCAERLAGRQAPALTPPSRASRPQLVNYRSARPSPKSRFTRSGQSPYALMGQHAGQAV